MAVGGKRPGAGRPKGSKNKFSIHDFVTKGDVETFVEFVLANYMESDKLAAWFGDQLFGKASQALTGPDGGPIQVQGVEISVRK
jgi:hypothetical protein